MKKQIILILLFLFIGIQFCIASLGSKATTKDSLVVNNNVKLVEEISKKSNKEIEILIGRKLGLKEKIALKIYRNLPNQVKSSLPEDEVKRANNKAVWSFGLAIGSFFIFPLAAIAGVILGSQALNIEKRNPGTLTPTNKTLANIGFWGSIGVLALLVIALFIVLLILTSFRI